MSLEGKFSVDPVMLSVPGSCDCDDKELVIG